MTDPIHVQKKKKTIFTTTNDNQYKKHGLHLYMFKGATPPTRDGSDVVQQNNKLFHSVDKWAYLYWSISRNILGPCFSFVIFFLLSFRGLIYNFRKFAFILFIFSKPEPAEAIRCFICKVVNNLNI